MPVAHKSLTASLLLLLLLLLHLQTQSDTVNHLSRQWCCATVYSAL